MGNMIFSRSLSRTSCQGNLELKQETRTGGGLRSMQRGRLEILAKATGRQAVMDGGGLGGEAIHLHAQHGRGSC